MTFERILQQSSVKVDEGDILQDLYRCLDDGRHTHRRTSISNISHILTKLPLVKCL